MGWLIVLCVWTGHGVTCTTPPTLYASQEECVAAVGEGRRVSNGTRMTTDFYAYCLRGGSAK